MSQQPNISKNRNDRKEDQWQKTNNPCQTLNRTEWLFEIVTNENFEAKQKNCFDQIQKQRSTLNW